MLDDLESTTQESYSSVLPSNLDHDEDIVRYINREHAREVAKVLDVTMRQVEAGMVPGLKYDSLWRDPKHDPNNGMRYYITTKFQGDIDELLEDSAAGTLDLEE